MDDERNMNEPQQSIQHGATTPPVLQQNVEKSAQNPKKPSFGAHLGGGVRDSIQFMAHMDQERSKGVRKGLVKGVMRARKAPGIHTKVAVIAGSGLLGSAKESWKSTSAMMEYQRAKGKEFRTGDAGVTAGTKDFNDFYEQKKAQEKSEKEQKKQGMDIKGKGSEKVVSQQHSMDGIVREQPRGMARIGEVLGDPKQAQVRVQQGELAAMSAAPASQQSQIQPRLSQTYDYKFEGQQREEQEQTMTPAR